MSKSTRERYAIAYRNLRIASSKWHQTSIGASWGNGEHMYNVLMGRQERRTLLERLTYVYTPAECAMQSLMYACYPNIDYTPELD